MCVFSLNRLHLLNSSSELLEVFTYALFVWRCLVINNPFILQAFVWKYVEQPCLVWFQMSSLWDFRLAYSLKFVSLLFMQRAIFEQLVEHKDGSVRWQASSVKHPWPNTVCLKRSCWGGMYYSVQLKQTNKQKLYAAT